MTGQLIETFNELFFAVGCSWVQLGAVLKQLMPKGELRVIDYYFFSGLSAAPSTISSSSEVTPSAVQIGTIASIEGRRS